MQSIRPLVLAGALALAWLPVNWALAQGTGSGVDESVLPQDASGLKPIPNTNSPNQGANEAIANPGLMQTLTAVVGLTKPESGIDALAPIHQNPEAPTYLRDVLPIFMGHCARCHNNQATLEFDWLNYRTAYRERWEIKRRIWDSWEGAFFRESMPLDKSPESHAISDAERKIIRNWVASGAVRGAVIYDTREKTKAERIVLGRRLATTLCAACHQADFHGLAKTFPPLAESDFLNADKRRAIQTVIFGRQGEVLVNGGIYNSRMPAFPLSDEDIANALTFVYNSLGNSGLEVQPEEVKALRREPIDTPLAPAFSNPYE